MPLITRSSPIQRGRVWSGDGIQWNHDGVNVDSFVLDIDGTEYDQGALTPITGTTYRVEWPEAVESGSHTVVVYAVNEDGRTASSSATVVKP